MTDDILTPHVLRKGIYKTLSEFKTNSPAITTDFTVKMDTGKYDRYWLYGKGRKVRNVYGFSDGNNTFIIAKVYGQTNYFVKILIVGEVIYFEDKRGKANAIGNQKGVDQRDFNVLLKYVLEFNERAKAK